MFSQWTCNQPLEFARKLGYMSRGSVNLCWFPHWLLLGKRNGPSRHTPPYTSQAWTQCSQKAWRSWPSAVTSTRTSVRCWSQRNLALNPGIPSAFSMACPGNRNPGVLSRLLFLSQVLGNLRSSRKDYPPYIRSRGMRQAVSPLKQGGMWKLLPGKPISQ